MIIPIGHEGQTVRRLPWITFALIAANLAVFITVGRTASDVEERMARAFDAAKQDWWAHPYLTPRPELRAAMAREMGEERFEAMEAAMNSSLHPTPTDADIRATEQQELDNLTAEWARAAESHPYGTWGLIPSRFRVLGLFTSMFMHAGWLHVLGNMFILYLAAPAVEDAWGRPLFLAFYLASGVVASLTFVLTHASSAVPLVGASGAIAGVMGAFLVRFTRTKIRFFYWFAFVFRGTFDAPAWLMLPLWLLEQAWMGSISSEGAGVAYLAHVGGFAFGVVVALTLRSGRIEERFIHPKIEAAISVSSHPSIERGMDHLARHDPISAREAFSEALAANARDPEAHLGMWESYLQDGNAPAGVEHMARVLEHDIKSGELTLAVERCRELAAAGVSAPAALRLRLANELIDADQQAAGMELLVALANDADSGLLGAKAAGRLAELSSDAAERARWRALAARGADSSGSASGPRPVVAPVSARAGGVPSRGATATTGTAAGAPGAIHAIERFVLDRLHPAGLVLRGPAGDEVVRYDALAAVAVAGIADGAKPYVITDLVLRGPSPRESRTIRLVSTEFDPRTIMERSDLPPLSAFRELILLIVRASAVQLRPAGGFLKGEGLVTFPSVAEYERAVLDR
jgi:membrane associated rhomboid family serine protease